MARVQDGKMKIRTKHWPSFLYDERGYDMNDRERGLFKGYFLLRVRHSSAIFCNQYDCFSTTGVPPHFYEPIVGYRKDKKRNKTQQSADLRDETCDWSHDRVCLRSGNITIFPSKRRLMLL
jgi:hypothetical protein